MPSTIEVRHRFVVLGGPTKRPKDPVFELMRKNAKLSNLLLHELLLYLLGKSLLVEREALYANLLRVAGTRNRLAHTGGDISLASGGLSNSEPDALQALRWVSEVLAWFEIGPCYRLPRSGMLVFLGGERVGEQP
jgi:hypothetical protein